MAYVEILQAEHVLEAMLSLGWQAGTKPPPYVAIQAKCREKFENGGDGGRIKKLREEAIAQAMRESGTLSLGSADVLPPSRLPDELQSAMEGLARDIGARLNTFDRLAATQLDRYRADAEATANARTNAIRKEAAEQATAFDEEITAALLALESSNATITDLETRLSAALAAAAHADGRASALADQVAALNGRIVELEKERKLHKTDCKPSGAKQQAKVAEQKAKSTNKQHGAVQQKINTPVDLENDQAGKPLPQQVALQAGGKD